MEDDEEMNMNEEEYEVRRRINNNRPKKKQKPCKTRFDVLATPHKRAILGTYQSHAEHFPKEKVKRMKAKIQELFAMTPEETEKYFEQMKNEANEIAKKKMMKITLRSLFRSQQNEKQEKRAYKFVKKLLQDGMLFVFSNPVPPLFTMRLRNLSNIILEQICDLRNVDIPDRENPDMIGLFLIAFADWAAITIQQIYYAVELKKFEAMEEIEEQEQRKRKEEKEKRPRSARETEIVHGGEEFDLLEQDLE